MANSPAYGLSNFALTSQNSTGNLTVFSNVSTGATQFTIDGYGNVTSASNTIVGRSLVFSDGSVLSTAGGASARFTYTGDGVTTAYSTGNYSATSTLNTNIYISGVYQNKDQYSWSGTTITFTQPPPAGLTVEIMITTINSVITVPSPGTVTPAMLSTGGPSWDSTGNLAITGNVWSTGTSKSYIAGSVGINTTNPTTQLHVRTSTQGTDGITIIGPNTSSQNGNMTIRPNNSQGSNNGITQAGDSGIIYSSNAGIGTGNLVIAPWFSGTSGIRMNGSGNVGIATTNATAPLHVFGAATGTGQGSAGAIVARFMDGQGRNSVTINGGIDGTAPATNATLNLGGGASLSYSLSATHGANMGTALAGTSSPGLVVGGYVGIGTANPQRFISIWNPTVSAEQTWTMAAGLLGKRTWNLVVDGGNGSTANNLSFRMLDESGNGVSGFGFSVNGTTGTFATAANRQISAASVPAGSVIQTAWNSLNNTAFTATSAALVNTGFSVSFTPQYNTSKVLHIVTIGVQFICDGQLRIYRNGASVSNSLMDSYRDGITTSYTNDMPAYTFTFLDNPGTTSAITYALYACATGCSNTVYVGSPGDFFPSWTCMEIAV